MTPNDPIPSHWKLPDLRVDRDGDWFDEGVQVTHPGILANLRGNLRRDDAGYFIQTRVRIPVRVDDAPFVIIRVERRGEELQAYLNDDTEERLDPAGLFDARFSRAAAWQLLQIAQYDESSGTGTLRVGGADWPLRRAS
jgi:hypothetical protein